MATCATCAKPLKSDNHTGYCVDHFHYRGPRPPARFCKCGASITQANISGQCVKCRFPDRRPQFAKWDKLRHMGLSITEISRRTGVHHSTLGKYFNDQGFSRYAACEAANKRAAADVELIAGHAWRVFSVPPGAIWTASRKPPISRARQAVFLVANERGASLAAIGRAFEYDHTTIRHGKMQAENFYARDADYAAGIETLRALVGAA